jgi:hypothetical protein
MYRRKHEESGGKNVPEARLYLSLWLGWTLPGGLFIVSILSQGYPPTTLLRLTAHVNINRSILSLNMKDYTGSDLVSG